MEAIVILKDLRFRSRLLNPVFIVVLALLFCTIVIALMLPSISCGPLQASPGNAAD
jgi:type II secretory pathway component PulF